MAKNEEFTGLQKAAILLITLGPERSADIFKHLKVEEIVEITLEMLFRCCFCDIVFFVVFI